MEVLVEEAQRLGVPEFLEKKRPNDVILECIKAARLNSDDVMKQLDEQMRLVQIGQIISLAGITAWNEFAVKIFGYNLESPLPPLSSKHVRAFTCTFRCHGTAANYITDIRWACNAWELSLAWDTIGVKVQLEGFKKLGVQQEEVVVKQSEVVLLREWITRVSLLCNKDQRSQAQVASVGDLGGSY